MNDIDILNCHVNNYTLPELFEDFKEGVFVSANIHMIMLLQHDPLFYQCYRTAAYSINDSRILFFLSKLLKTPLRATIAGSDFLPAFYYYHKHDKDVRMFLLGAKENIAKIAMETINNKIGREMVVGEYSPPFNFEHSPETNDIMIQRINNSGATVLAVGLSAPKGEIWVFRNKEKMINVKRFLCIGATIDFEAGTIRRAPVVLRMIGLEWLFRIFMEPRRLWKRYLIEDSPFFLLFAKQLLGKYRDPFINA